jgi:hypothetical protein
MRARPRTPAAPLALAVALLAPAAALADAAVDGEAVDVSAIKNDLKLLSDGRNHYIAVVPFGSGAFEHLYYGDGKTFYLQRVVSGGSSGTESFDRTFWDPRAGSSFGFHDGKYTLECGTRKTAFTPVEAAAAAKLLGEAKWRKPRWKHRAYALARDDEGNYFFVDRQREPEDSKAFRLYMGPKGKLALMKMTNVVSDSEGDMFATKTGQLRLILGKSESTWVHGKIKKKLVLVPVEDNAALIYNELGVYTGQPLGTPCDDL